LAIITHLGTVENLKKRLILAIVDEDSDLTYYEVKKTVPNGTYKLGSEKKLSTASLLEDRVMVWDPEASAALQRQGFFGKPMDEGHLQLSLVESCYLLKNGVLEIEDRDKLKLDYTDFSTIASKIESNFMVKYAVYENLRNSGLVPKTGFKFGTHFRVYKKIEDMAKLPHSDYLIHAIEHDHIFSLQQLSRAVRLANSVRKDMIYGAVDSHVQFFVVGRMRL
jgi:tRNA intron endonuclease